MLNVQSANLAVHGYGNDQAYLRLEQELPRFRRPVGVVSLFMTTLLSVTVSSFSGTLYWHGDLTGPAGSWTDYRSGDTNWRNAANCSTSAKTRRTSRSSSIVH